MTNDDATRSSARLGSVDAYALDRFLQLKGNQVTCSAVYADYRIWCASRHAIPLRETEFVAAVEELARSVGIPFRQRGGNLSFLDVALGNAGVEPSGR